MSDKTPDVCHACISLHTPGQNEPCGSCDGIVNFTTAPEAEFKAQSIAWAVSRWVDEVSQRPLKNAHRRTLDDTWRQVIRHFGGDPIELLGPAHDELVAAAIPDSKRYEK